VLGWVAMVVVLQGESWATTIEPRPGSGNHGPWPGHQGLPGDRLARHPV